jgi:hypothetical protein
MQALAPFVGGDPSRLPRSAGEAIRMLSSFSPRQFYSLLPSQRELRQSLVSGLGVDPRDNIASIMAAFPTATAVNPAATTFGNFAKGGRVLVAPA